MTSYSKLVEIRWSDLDPNFHVRHSVYYDFGAYVRMSFLAEYGLPAAVLIQNQLGPILFREECIFKREILFHDSISINLVLKKCSPNYSRWTMQHEIIKNGEILAAVMTVDGAWIDATKRKLTVPTAVVTPTFEQLPRSEDFIWLD
jgi:acyl-CoA thioester hydrolase